MYQIDNAGRLYPTVDAALDALDARSRQPLWSLLTAEGADVYTTVEDMVARARVAHRIAKKSSTCTKKVVDDSRRRA